MEQRQIEGIDAYNFPPDLNSHPLLSWMGDDYVQFIATELQRHFQQQDPGAAMLAIKCEERPELLTTADEQTGTVRSVVAKFELQVLLLASGSSQWRLVGDGRFRASGLHSGRQSIAVEFDVRSTE